MAGSGVTPGDPRGGEPEAPERRSGDALSGGGEPDAPERRSGYGSGPVPPGAFARRERGEVVDPYADAPPAEWSRRAIAAILDALLIAGVAAFVFLLLGALLFGAFDLDEPGGVVGALVTGLFVLFGVSVGAFVYAPLVMAQSNGKTLGKMATRCRVVRGDGRRVDFLWAAYREVVVKAIALGIAGAITGGIAYLVDLLWPFFDGRKRALHDIVVDSRVVRD